MKHTPGPWKAAQPKHDPQAWDVCTESGGVLAKLPWGGEGGANAKLMAAAPDMRAALERVAAMCLEMKLADENNCNALYAPGEVMEVAVTALAKAAMSDATAGDAATHKE